jgi:hypothetical protein
MGPKTGVEEAFGYSIGYKWNNADGLGSSSGMAKCRDSKGFSALAHAMTHVQSATAPRTAQHAPDGKQCHRPLTTSSSASKIQLQVH